MSDFQTSVNFTQPNGIPGEIAYGIPTNVQALSVDSATAGNYFGYAYTRTGDENATVGGTGAFAGILIHSHEVATGTVEGGVNFKLPQHYVGSFLTAGSVKVSVAAACAIGDLVMFTNATGAITTMPPIAEFTASQSTTVLTVSAVTAGTGTLGIGSVVKNASGEILGTIISLGTGTGGTGTYNLNTSATVGSASMTANSVAVSTKTLIKNAKVDYYSLTGAGVATIKLLGV